MSEQEINPVLYFHDSLIEFIARSGMTSDIATPAVLMLAASVATNLDMTEDEIIANFRELLRGRSIDIAMNKKPGETLQ